MAQKDIILKDLNWQKGQRGGEGNFQIEGILFFLIKNVIDFLKKTKFLPWCLVFIFFAYIFPITLIWFIVIIIFFLVVGV